ncbi:MAG: hypothetical protein M5U28_30815 [Sandaracinaceae bacterium]|nr:hypothetical protein [Sandaracinaceae bacterium]
MHLHKLPVNRRAADVNRRIEEAVNEIIRARDHTLGRIGLGGRKANYDDLRYEFLGGPADLLRTRHYDKSLRLLWKAEPNAPYLGFRDASREEKLLFDLALSNLGAEERRERERLSMPEYKALLDREYTRREKQAIVNILSAIGHGEAYAWLVSAELLGQVQSTGARAALTMQVLEEAKHFVVLRELLAAFDVPIRRQSAWEYLLLERVYKARGVEKLFGMNVLVEGIALGLFGLMGEMPGLELLRLFHLDESRHTALPVNYFAEFPLTRWERLDPLARARRLAMVLPTLALVPYLEEDMAELGIDAFEFGGAVIRKVTLLAERAGFELGMPREELLALLDRLFNVYCARTRPGFRPRRFVDAETTRGASQLEVERDVFGGAAAAS